VLARPDERPERSRRKEEIKQRIQPQRAVGDAKDRVKNRAAWLCQLRRALECFCIRFVSSSSVRCRSNTSTYVILSSRLPAALFLMRHLYALHSHSPAHCVARSWREDLTICFKESFLNIGFPIHDLIGCCSCMNAQLPSHLLFIFSSVLTLASVCSLLLCYASSQRLYLLQSALMSRRHRPDESQAGDNTSPAASSASVLRSHHPLT
jgi:hypothetical protein